jgi:beta-ureidopropionase
MKRIRVLTTCQNEDRTFNNGELVSQAMSLAPDIVCLPENLSKLGITDTHDPEPVPGPTTLFFMDLARVHRCYFICPLLTKREGRVHNSAVIIDRAGQIMGIYDKVHPVTVEHDYTSFEGLTPGGSVPTFDLDFGRVGIQICFDIGFPESWAELSDRGARLVFWPSAYTGGFPLQAYAWQHHYYVVSSVRTDMSRIIDPCGNIVAQTTARHKVAWYDLSLDFVVAHNDFNYRVPREILAKYGDRVRIRSCADEGCFLAEPTDENISMATLQEEFGFESIQQYHDRHRAGYPAALRGEKPRAQAAAHGRRPQYSD